MSGSQTHTGESTDLTSPLKIVIVSEPPLFVYSEEWFSVTLDLSASYPSEIPVPYVELCANLYRVRDGKINLEPAQDNDVVDLHLAHQSVNDSTNLDDHSSTVVKCKIKSPLEDKELPTKYCLKFFQRSRQTGSILQEVEQACSSPVQIVRYKLILEHEWDSNIFYKDEGGKEKCLRASISLHQKDEVVKGVHLPLRLQLKYDDNELNPVLKQEETLKILGNTKQFIDPETGDATIKFRFEDVSKNHQGLAFRLEVSPDARRLVDTAPVMSPGIIVRSKRNKRQSSSPGRRRQQSHMLTRVAPIQNSFSNEEDSSCQIWNRRDIDAHEALLQVSAWTKEVTRVLPSLKWNLIGYCQNTDGSADYTKPNHVMPYPNDCISRIINTFTSETSACLQVLKESLESTSVLEKTALSHPAARDIDAGRSHTQVPPATYFPGNEEYDYSPQSQYNAVPVTPQNRMFRNPTSPHPHPHPHPNPHPHPHPHPNPHQQHRQGLSDEVVPRKRQRCDTDTSTNWPQQKEHALIKSVEYILAKHFDKFGFPVYNGSKEIVGFYRESSNEIGVGRFIPLSEEEDKFTNTDKEEATRVISEAIARKNPAVHCIKDWGSIQTMFDHAMVYDWSKDFGHN